MKRRSAMGPAEEEGKAFSLPELLVALALGLVLAALVMQGLVRVGRGGERLALAMRERLLARRTLALLRSELQSAQRWQAGAGGGAACGLGGRTPVLHLEAEGRAITYSVGSPPSPIWRGQVLMRCGPAYGLWGELSGGASQNRVLLDGLAPRGLAVLQEAPGLLRLRLRQEFALRDGASLPLRLEIQAVAPAQ
jgi:prepilin-type N-terminal cleavage/methylation domain-containing protein